MCYDQTHFNSKQTFPFIERQPGLILAASKSNSGIFLIFAYFSHISRIFAFFPFVSVFCSLDHVRWNRGIFSCLMLFFSCSRDSRFIVEERRETSFSIADQQNSLSLIFHSNLFFSLSPKMEKVTSFEF